MQLIKLLDENIYALLTNDGKRIAIEKITVNLSDVFKVINMHNSLCLDTIEDREKLMVQITNITKD